MKFTAYTDSGHGWVKVKKDLLTKLGIQHKISRYSYMRGDYAYLEEDCDVEHLYKALLSQGKDMSTKVQYSYKRSKIRSYNSYASW